MALATATVFATLVLWSAIPAASRSGSANIRRISVASGEDEQVQVEEEQVQVEQVQMEEEQVQVEEELIQIENTTQGDVGQDVLDKPQTYALPLSAQELQAALEYVKGDDNRLFRWDATTQTKQKRRKGACLKLPQAVATIMADNTTVPSVTLLSKTMAAEFLTFCITDSSLQRQRFSELNGVHQAVIDMVASAKPPASFMASHLIYISAFANKQNHQTFIENDAIPALAKVVMKNSASE